MNSSVQVSNRITAEDARHLSTEANISILNKELTYIYGEIRRVASKDREAGKKGLNIVSPGGLLITHPMVEEVINDLRKAGYNAESTDRNSQVVYKVHW
jgi:hypothetical protein